MKPHRRRILSALSAGAVVLTAFLFPSPETTVAEWGDAQQVTADDAVTAGRLGTPQGGTCTYNNGLLGLALQSVTVTWLDSGIEDVKYAVGFVENGSLVPVPNAKPTPNGGRWTMVYQEGLLSGLLTGLLGKTVVMFVQPQFQNWQAAPMRAELHMTGLLGSATKCDIITGTP